MNRLMKLPPQLDWPKWLSELMNSKAKLIWLDCTDFVQYAEGGNTTVSGIQRVVANLVTHAEDSEYVVIPVIPEFDRMRVLAADRNEVEALVRTLQSGNATRERISELLRNAYDSRIEVVPRSGDLFVMAGAFWIYHHHDLLIELRRNCVSIVLFVHDLIQLTHPEYLSAVANRTFRRSLVDVLAVVDLVLTNSIFVAGEVADYLKERLSIDIPVHAVQLPTELPVQQVVGTKISPRVQQIARKDFVLCVGTIEIRKNHILLVKIWEKLLSEGAVAVPDLVFVGKWGWNIDELRSHLDRNAHVGNWLHILNDLPDAELNYLYEKCLMTAYPSFAEGWGLPVGESLAHGKPCAASSATSLPEVGGEFARYFDPLNFTEGYSLFRELFRDRSTIDRWANDIAERFVPKTWNEFCKEFFDEIASPTLSNSYRVANYRFSTSQFYSFGEGELPKLDALGGQMVTPRMNRWTGWGPIEGPLVWTNEPLAGLRLKTALTPGTEVLIYVKIKSQLGNPAKVKADAGAGEIILGKVAEHPEYRSIPGRVAGDGSISVNFVVLSWSGEHAHPLRASLGLYSFAFCARDDLIQRISLLELMAMQSPDEKPVGGEKHGGDVGCSRDSLRFLVRYVSRAGSQGGLSGLLWRGRLELARLSARRKKWSAAEKQYGRLLQSRPKDAKLWKQYGHMLKEQKLWTEAAFAYGLSLDLDNSDEDTWVHYRHARGQVDASE